SRRTRTRQTPPPASARRPHRRPAAAASSETAGTAAPARDRTPRRSRRWPQTPRETGPSPHQYNVSLTSAHSRLRPRRRQILRTVVPRGLTPFEYLRDLLTRLPRTTNRQLAELLPAA